MKNLVLTMTDRNYFQYGKRLLETRHIVDADFICYGPDLTFGQIKELHEHDIAYTNYYC